MRPLRRDAPGRVRRCDSTRLKVLRVGVARATEELAALTGVDAVEVTGRAPATGRAAASPLVVGTEAALHRAGRVEVVAFLDLDQHLLAPAFGAAEETLALLARAARLTGGREGERRAGSSSRPGWPTTRCWRPPSGPTRRSRRRRSAPCGSRSIFRRSV